MNRAQLCGNKLADTSKTIRSGSGYKALFQYSLDRKLIEDITAAWDQPLSRNRRAAVRS